MANDSQRSKDPQQTLRAAIKENQRLVRQSQALVSQLDQGFAAVKDMKAKARQRQARSSTPFVSPPKTQHARRILLVEDHPIVSLGISELINYEADLKVMGVAAERVSALQQVEALKPDLVILDLCLNQRSDLELLKQIKARFPHQRVLILSLHDEAVYAPRALRAGACGYVMKEEATETLLRAIRLVLSGQIYLSAAMTAQAAQTTGGTNSPHEPLQDLTDRELEIFQLIGQGKPTRDIAALLCVSLKTIETHRTNMKHKLEVKSATELVQMAIEAEHNPAHIVHS